MSNDRITWQEMSTPRTETWMASIADGRVYAASQMRYPPPDYVNPWVVRGFTADGQPVFNTFCDTLAEAQDVVNRREGFGDDRYLMRLARLQGEATDD